MKITLLKPTWSEARTAKSFRLENGKPKLTNTFNLGKTFFWGTTEVNGLKQYYDLLLRCQNNKVFRLAGEPVPNLPKKVRRLKDNFSDSGTQLLLLDADEWKLPSGYDLKTPENIHAAIKHMLCDKMGMDFLRNASCIVLFSSQAWSYYTLRAHIYFYLSEAVSLEFLHEWGKAFNSLDFDYKIDYSLFRQVQPDYISKRICEGFRDPLHDSLRLTLHCDSLSPTIDSAALTEHFKRDIKIAGAYSEAVSVPTVSKSTTNVVKTNDKGLGETWEQTLKLCGSAQHGINDPAYRACAQLVQQIGNKTVEANLNYYVEKIFSVVWESVNVHGVRGNKKDRDYYDKARFRNYITTALQKNFGEDTDSTSNEIARAIKLVIGGSSPAILFDNDLLEKYRVIRSKDPGKWALIRNVIKNKLKGKVAISDIDKALSSASKADISHQIQQVIKSFEWVEGTIDQGLYCKTKRPDGYSLIGIDAGVDSDLYAKALELFDDAVPHNFEKNVMKVIAARSRDSQSTPFSKAIVENRCHTVLENGKNTLYFNMGEDAIGDMTTCVVTEDSVNIVPSKDVPIIWSTNKSIMPCEVEEPTTTKAPDVAKFYIKKYLQKFRKFITVEDAEAVIDVIAWQVASVINTGTAPLLEIAGASGDGKSTSALFIKELIDPTSSHIRDGQDLHNGFYKKEDLAKVLRARHVTIFDNLSNLHPSIQDLLCSVATGWRYDLRIIYTQQFLSLVIKKPVILTCLAPVITNQDLRSRSMSVSVSRKRKMLSDDVYRLWEEDKKEMRTGFFFVVSHTIKYVNALRAQNSDLNDRDLWATAARTIIMKLINYKQGDEKMIKSAILRRKIDRDIHEAMTSTGSSQIMAWIMGDVDTFNGTMVRVSAAELFMRFKQFLNEHAGEKISVHGIPVEVGLRSIPKSVRGFGIMLSKTRNDIHSITGWEMDTVRSGGVRQRVFIKDPNHSILKKV